MLSRTLNKISRTIFDISDAQRKQRSKNPIPSQIFDFLIDLSAFCAALLVLGMAVTIGLNVLLRKVFLAPIEWALPMTEFSLLYITFLAAPVVLRREGHVRISASTEQLGHEWKVRLYILGSSIGFLVCAILVWQSASATWKEIQSGAVLLRELKSAEHSSLGLSRTDLDCLEYSSSEWVITSTEPKSSATNLGRQ